jgi:hypothetical protein
MAGVRVFTTDFNRKRGSLQTETMAAPSFPNPKSKMVYDAISAVGLLPAQFKWV